MATPNYGYEKRQRELAKKKKKEEKLKAKAAGKGHEDYQIIGSEKLHFDDREVAREALRKRSRA